MVGPLAGCNGTARSSTVGSTHQSSVPGVANAIRTIVADTGHDAFGPPSAGERAQLAALYAPRRDVPLWVDTSGRPSRDAREALALLSGAANEGLDPVEYAAPMLEQMARMLESTAPAATDVADFDTSLSANTLRYLRQLHEGRVDPRAIGFHMTTPADEHDFVAFLSDAVTRHRIIEAAAELTPPFALYRGLRSMLARYRSLAADPTLESLLPPGAPVRPGDRYAELRTLHRRLVALGDLPGDTPLPEGASVYEGALIDGVKHFRFGTVCTPTACSAEGRKRPCECLSRGASDRLSLRSSDCGGCRTWTRSGFSPSISRCSASGPGTRFPPTVRRHSGWV